eukprot:COSAG02_NODE_19863_length_861_cov_0.930446_1_plen_270_part_00
MRPVVLLLLFGSLAAAQHTVTPSGRKWNQGSSVLERARSLDRKQAVLLRWAGDDSTRERHLFSDQSIALELGISVSDVDIWGMTADGGVMVMLPERAVAQATATTSALPFRVSAILMPDVEVVVADQRRTHQPHWNESSRSRDDVSAARGIESEFFDDYRDLNSVHDYLQQLASAHPHIARHIPSIGTSFEGFPLPAIEIGGRAGGPAVYIQATSHSREWISTSTAMAVVVELLQSEDEELRRIVDQLRFFVLPVVSVHAIVLHRMRQR